MRKYLLVLFIALALVSFASCATKAQAEETPAKPAVAEVKEAEPVGQAATAADEVPSSLIHFEISDDGEHLVVITQCYPDEGWLWHPVYESEEDAKKIVWLEDMYETGSYKFNEAETDLPAQKHVFKAVAPAEHLQFGLAFKQNGGERKGEFVVLINIKEDLKIEVLNFNSGLV